MKLHQRLWSFAVLGCALLLAGHAQAAAHGRLRIKTTVVKEQVVDTPVPIFVRLEGDTQGVVVQLHYHPASKKHWRHRTMKAMGKGYGSSIPCDRVRGEALVSYYIRVKKHGKTIAKSGSEKNPYVVAFVPSLKGPAPSLPGKAPPHKCSKEASAGEGSEAGGEGEASGGEGEASGGEGEASGGEGEASGGEGEEGMSEPRHRRHHHRRVRHVWIDFGIAQDVAMLGGNNVCSAAGQKAGFYCFRNDGKQYLGNPVPGEYDKISSGLALSATRLLVGVDYTFGAAAIGARLGFTVHGGSPKPYGGSSSLPVLASARLEYWFTKHAYVTRSFAAFLLGEGGLAEADAKHRVTIVEDTTNPAKQVNPAHQQADAWKRMGRGFAGLGLGGFIPVGKSGGVVIELEGRVMFPSSGFVLAPGLYYALGF